MGYYYYELKGPRSKRGVVECGNVWVAIFKLKLMFGERTRRGLVGNLRHCSKASAEQLKRFKVKTFKWNDGELCLV